MNRISHFLAAALFVAQIVNITPIDQKYQIKLDAPERVGDSYDPSKSCSLHGDGFCLSTLPVADT